MNTSTARCTLTVPFRTKAEAKDAIKAGADVKLIVRGKVADAANGRFAIKVKLDHYKEWSGEASVWGGVIERIT